MKIFWRDETKQLVGEGALRCERLSFSDLPRIDQLRESLSEGEYLFVVLGFDHSQRFPDLLLYQPKTLYSTANAMSAHLLARTKTRCEQKISKEKWRGLLQEAFAAFRDTGLKKVVLGRQWHHHLEEELDFFAWYQALEQEDWAAKSRFSYALDLGEGQALMGFSPERLLSLRNDMLCCDALAGTRETDHVFEDKEKQELRYVQTFLQEKLSRWGSPIASELKRLELGYLSHLRQEFSMKVEQTVPLSELLCSLHPTPAVGGYPRDEARAFIALAEPEPRGWFTGTIGCVSKHEADFAVIIRSAMLDQKRLSLFAGAGIVMGSDPDQEWEETQLKMQPFLRLLSS